MSEIEKPSGLFLQTLDTICIEVKEQFLNGAFGITLIRDGDAIFCEPLCEICDKIKLDKN